MAGPSSLPGLVPEIVLRPFHLTFALYQIGDMLILVVGDQLFPEIAMFVSDGYVKVARRFQEDSLIALSVDIRARNANPA